MQVAYFSDLSEPEKKSELTHVVFKTSAKTSITTFVFSHNLFQKLKKKQNQLKTQDSQDQKPYFSVATEK